MVNYGVPANALTFQTNKEEIPPIISFIFDLLEGAGLLISKYPNEIAYVVGKLLLSVASTEVIQVENTKGQASLSKEGYEIRRWDYK